MQFTIHKSNNSNIKPKVSIILLDWSVRERFQALEWLPRQNVPREDYELIWIELYDRLAPEALEIADVVITCHQRGQYHKHVGYNIGLLQAKGQIITVCDSDAVFPPDFVASVINSFQLTEKTEPLPLVLMHFQWRTAHLYPDELSDVSQLSQYQWHDLWPNVGACMSVRRIDAIRFGGFDEHASYRGYMCGPYDLGWRLVNAGIPEVWHDPGVALWHFAHPDPIATFGQHFSWKLWREITHPHIKGHALTAVEAFSTGRLLPRQENPKVRQYRLAARRIGTPFEEEYAWVDPTQFSTLAQFKLNIFRILSEIPYFKRIYYQLGLPARIRWQFKKHKDRIISQPTISYASLPRLIKNYRNFNIVHYENNYYALNRALGEVDLTRLEAICLSEYQANGQCVVGDALIKVQKLVDDLSHPTASSKGVQLLASFTNKLVSPSMYNLIREHWHSLKTKN
jgi:hypothetical protein